MRYLLVDTPGGTWGILDTHTLKPVDYNGKPAVGLTKEYAHDMMVLLESSDIRRELTRKHTMLGGLNEKRRRNIRSL